MGWRGFVMTPLAAGAPGAPDDRDRRVAEPTVQHEPAPKVEPPSRVAVELRPDRRLWHHARRMDRLRVLEFIRHPDTVWNLPRAHAEALARDFPEVSFVSPGTAAEVDAALPEADVVLGWAVRRENFGLARRLRWIQVTAAGVASMMFPELVESDVIVTNGRGLHAVAMAEHTLGVLLMFARKLHLARDAQLRREWIATPLWAGPPPFLDLGSTTMVLVGLGAIGRAIATRARSLGVRVVAVRRHPAAGDPAPADEQWGVGRLDDLIERADWLVLVPALTAETRGMIGPAQLARLRPHAALINLGRGALVDEAALIETLRAGRIAGAALDVVREEPLPADSPLWGMPNVILTPHVSGFGPRYWERSVDLFRRNLRAYLDGRALENVVDKRAGY
jgi:phosphoglycerate dehydrogenase-like enzyme